jgi:hypothetical protein
VQKHKRAATQKQTDTELGSRHSTDPETSPHSKFNLWNERRQFPFLILLPLFDD